MTTDPIAFVVARLDEDERYARMALADDRHGKSAWVVDGKLAVLPSAMSDGLSLHFVRHDPARVLREIEATRALIASYEQISQGDGRYDRVIAGILFLQIVTRTAIWNDHPDFRPEWKP